MADATCTVKVVVKCRPLLGFEKERGAEDVLTTDGNEITINKGKTFAFDNTLPQGSTQEDVFKATASPRLDSGGGSSSGSPDALAALVGYAAAECPNSFKATVMAAAKAAMPRLTPCEQARKEQEALASWDDDGGGGVAKGRKKGGKKAGGGGKKKGKKGGGKKKGGKKGGAGAAAGDGVQMKENLEQVTVGGNGNTHRAAVAENELLKEQTEQLKGETQSLRESSKSDDVKMQKLVLKTAEAEKLKHDLREVGTLNGVVAQKDKRIVELEENLARAEQQRRKLHNQVQELRGNVRVFARVRPFLAADKVPEGAAEPSSAVMCNRTCNSLQVAGREDETFNFDKTFAQSSSQSEVFEEVQDFVQSALDGYNVCLFAYGQTGSGKTHTMQGSTEGEMRGIIPRSVEKILTSAKGLEAQGWAYTFKVSFLEIHNEVIRDLLVRGGSAGDAKLEIRMGAGRDKQLHVPGLMEETVSEMSQIERLLMVAAGNRSVAKTAMNADSSRSHSVFIMKMSGINESKKIRLTGTLNLCDLAGSERLKKSAVTGDRLKESQAINKSLSCLSGVFAALGRKDAHIPFRDSKLTYLMQNCLSGNGKTLMMVNLSPTESSQQESMSSLRFAGKARSCELGKPKRQMVDALGTEADGSGGGSSKRHRPSSKS